MAFCTVCGAQVAGAFCSKCGTPVGVSAGQPAQAPPPMSPPPMTPPPMSPQPMSPAVASAPMPAPVRRKTSPLVWVLIIILGLFGLGFAAIVGGIYFIAHRPGYAIAKLVTAGNPNVDVVNTDNGARTITLRDRHTGKEVTLSFDDVRNGRFRMMAQGDDGKTASVEFGGSVKAPSWVPQYPGSHPQALFSATGDSADGSGEGGNFMFTTSDPMSKVSSFYQDEAKRLGMEINVTSQGSEGSMMIASNEAQQRSLTVVIAQGNGETTVNVTYGRKR